MRLPRRSKSAPAADASSELVRPVALPRPLPTRDVRTLLVAQAVMNKANEADIDVEVEVEPESATDSIPPEVRAWAQSILGTKEECTCSSHCQQRPSPA